MYKYNIELINEYLQESNLTKSEFAKKANIKESVIEKIFNNDFRVGLKELCKIAKLVNVEIWKLIVED